MKEHRSIGIRLLALLLCSTFLAFSMSSSAQAKQQNNTRRLSSMTVTEEREVREMKGVWIATVCNLDFPSVKTRDADRLKKEIDTQILQCRNLGFNTIFLQVRPSCDAIYPSAIFPWSVYLTGQQGVGPTDGFDPLAYWIAQAHANEMELHAWINPYRITKYGNSEYNALSEDNPAKQHPEWVVLYSDKNYYFNPGIPMVRQLIIQGVSELLENYELDGIHMDDYFYPGKDFNDAAAFAAYNNGAFERIEDWRRNNVDLLIQELSTLIRGCERQVQFGISPAGIWENQSANPLGSNTSGGHPSYSKLFADTRKWALEEWIDYIVPQIYWQIGHTKADYITIANWWAETLKDSNTRLYIGIGDYIGLDAKPDSVWYQGAEVSRQLAYNDTLAKIEGEVHFRYGTIMQDQAVQTVLQNAYRQQ